MLPQLDEIMSNFEMLEDSNDRLEYLIELGRLAEPLAPEKKTEANRVRGCASQVWLDTATDHSNGRTVLRFHGDSDAIITRGIVALIAAIFSGKTPEDDPPHRRAAGLRRDRHRRPPDGPALQRRQIDDGPHPPRRPGRRRVRRPLRRHPGARRRREPGTHQR